MLGFICRRAVRPLFNAISNPLRGYGTAPATRVRTQKSEEVFQRESKYGAHNYGPIPVALCKAKGQYIYMYFMTSCMSVCARLDSIISSCLLDPRSGVS